MLKTDSNTSLPAGFIDALISYALDPTAWEAFAQALNRDGQKIEALDPTALLTTLSQAETLPGNYAARQTNKTTMLAVITSC